MTSVATAEARQPASAGPAQNGSPVAWTPNRELDAHEWMAAGRRIGAIGRCIQWLLGDWIAYGNAKFGERYARVSKITGYDTQTLMNMVYVASRFSISRRRENLSWSHHEALAALPAGDQDHWLEEAIVHRWSVADLRVMLRMSRKEGPEDPAATAIEADVAAGSGGVAPGESIDRHAVVKCPRCGEEVPLEQRD